MLNFAFLGTSGAIQHAESDNASLVVNSSGRLFLIDVGGSVLMKFRQLDCEMTKLDGLIITHGHVDHIYGLPSLIHQMWLLGREAPFHIYGLPDVIELCVSMISLFGLDKKKGMFEHVFVPISNGVVFEQDGLSICCHGVHHGVPALGVLLKLQNHPVLYYSGDSVFEPAFAQFAKGSQVIIHEASYLCELGEVARRKGHSTAQEAGIFAQMCETTQLYMFHFDAAYEGRLGDFAEEAKKEFEGQVIIPEPLVWYNSGI